MKYDVQMKISNSSTIDLKLNDDDSPRTVSIFVDKLPFTVNLNVWGDEIYTSETPIIEVEENSKPIVNLNDVAYWPAGKAICLFFGPTPISTTREIIPASPVNVVGKIISQDNNIINNLSGQSATFILN